MPNTAQVKFNEIDLTQRVGDIAKGIVFISVETVRGPFGHDGSIINSWEQFKAKYGGERVSLPGPSLMKRLLSYGARVRVNRIGSYVDPSDSSTLDAVLAVFDPLLGENLTNEVLFKLVVRYKGADYNNLSVHILEASNGQADYFDLTIEHALEPGLNESYINLKYPGHLSINDQLSQSPVWLGALAESKLVEPVYVDTSALLGALVPETATYDATTGSDGTAPVEADYTGDPAGNTGWYAADDYDDFTHIAAFFDDDDLIISGSAYTSQRKDCVLVASLNNDSASSTIITAKQLLNIDNKYIYLVTGSMEVNDTLQGGTIVIRELADVVGIAAKSEAEYGPWWSFAGHNRGGIQNALGIASNFGTAGKINELNDLANAQINAVVNKKGKLMVWGNFSGQLKTSVKSFIANVKLGIFLQKSLGPVLETFLEEPNDPATWKLIANTVAPFLDDLAGPEKRALHSYQWLGDQDVQDLDELQINSKDDVLAGKYKVQLVIVEIVSLQEFTVNIVSTKGGDVTFE